MKRNDAIALGIVALLALVATKVAHHADRKERRFRVQCEDIGGTVIELHRSALCVKDGLIINGRQ